MKKKRFTVLTSFILISSLLSSGNISAYSISDTLTLSDSFFVKDGTISYKDTEWYKVNYLEDNKPYLITVCNPDGSERLLTASYSDHENCIWNYKRDTNTSSTRPPHSTLDSENDYLMCYDDEVAMNWSSYLDSASIWKYESGNLYYTSADIDYYIKLDEKSRTGLSYTDDVSEADKINIYTHGERLGKCITEQPKSESYVIADSGYEATIYSISVSENTEIDAVIWYVDDESYQNNSLEFRADSLKGQSAGVHKVKCLVEGHDSENTHYRETSATASFIIANGVIPDSFMTFSDLHEEFNLIGDAITTVMDENNGCIPSLIVCSGDWVNGPSGDYDRVMNQFYPRFVAQFGGIDAVFVAGNHDNGKAAADMSVLAGLGADKISENNCGVIFSGNSDEVNQNANSGKYGKSLVVYGINYQASAERNGFTWNYDYTNVINDLGEFLENTSKNYNGELIVISAHSGLHILGIQPESVNPENHSISNWAGDGAYNIDKSDELAELINRYSADYDMNIIYLFGHNHSRKETEMFLSDGDTVISTHSYQSKQKVSQILNFTYAHSGYLSSEIGCADKMFSIIKCDGESFTYDLMKIGSGIVRHEEIASKTPIPETKVTTVENTVVVTTAVTSVVAAETTTTAAASSADKKHQTTSRQDESETKNSPNTSDSGSVMAFLALFTAIAFISRKRA